MSEVIPGEAIPLSRLQQSMWFVEQCFGSSPLWNLTLELRLKGRIDAEVLQDAHVCLVARHSIFRIRVSEAGGIPFQWLAEDEALRPAFEDLSSLQAAEEALENRTLELAQRPFDLRLDAPIRVDVIKVAPDDHVVLFRLHHIVSDGHSVNLLVAELGEIYRAKLTGVPVALPPLETDYFGWIAREQEPEHERRLRAGGDYWVEALAGAPTTIDLGRAGTGARPRHRGGSHRFAVGGELALALRAIVKRNRAVPTILFLACLQALVGRMLGLDDLIVGLTVNGRASRDVRRAQGLFANVVPIRATIDWDEPFDAFLRRQRDNVRSAMAWQDVPLHAIVERCNPVREPDRQPLVQVSLNYWSPDPGLFAVEGVEAQYRQLEIDQSRFELSLKVVSSGDGFDCTIEYDRDLFAADQVAGFAHRLVRMLEGVAERPSDSLRVQRYLSDEERARLGTPPAAAPTPPLVAGLVARNADRDPGAPAILLEDGRVVDRAALDARSSALAERLLALGVGRDIPVALPLPRGAEMIVAQLAVIKAGGCFIPLDPDHPPERLREIFRASGARAVIAADGFEGPAGDDMPPILGLPAGEAPIVAARPDPGLTERQLAYIIYTSGSTGEPKGVMIEHAALANLVAWYRRAHAIAEGDRIGVLAGPGFDSTIYEIWPALCAGSVLVPATQHLTADPEAVRDWIVAMGITVAFAPTPLGQQLIRLAWPDRTRLRTLQIGGDRLAGRPPADLPFRVVNSYGPAEGTVVSAEGVVAPAPAAGVPDIGIPIDGVELLVLDDKAVAVPDGAPGDLHIAGANLARGYLGRPDLTDERFFVHGGYGGRRLYRTGDFGRRGEDGRFECLGRLDRQVKIRGQRIEIGEVEQALLKLKDVREAAVLHSPGADGTGELTAFVVARGAADPVRIRNLLRERLPVAMIPGRIVPIERMPLTRNGKLDREALAREGIAAIQGAAGERGTGSTQRIELAALLEGLAKNAVAASSAAGARNVEGRDELERMIKEIWEEVLRLDTISPHDNFFDLGGHSLLAVRVVGRLRALTGFNLTMGAFFQYPTVAALADWMSADRRQPPNAAGAER